MLALAGRHFYLAGRVAALTALAVLPACHPQHPAPSGPFEPASRDALGAAASRTQPAGYQLVRIRWRSDDGQVNASGNGAVRIAPDSLRVDMAVRLGVGRATLILAGDSVAAEPPDLVERLLPDRYALWAAMGVMQLPPGALDIGRLVDRGRTFWRLDDGHGRQWVYELRGDTLVGVTRSQDGKPVARLVLEHGSDGQVTQAQATDLVRGARFEMDVISRESSAAFPEMVWRLRP